MRPPFKKLLQTSALMTGAIALVLSSAGIAGAADEPVDPEPETTFTEDNDTNDGDTPNNVADDGDDAHPSGKDRSVENGGSGNQGDAQSDPDDDGRGPDRSPEGNEGADKPNGPGGIDKADQDGNNGCGNDDDFEDDNEGLCLGPDGAPGQQEDDEEQVSGDEFCPDGETVITDDADADMDGDADMCEEQVSGDEFCPDGETVITDDADADMDGDVDMCEESTNGSDGGETPVVVDDGEQLPTPAVEDGEEIRQPAPVTDVEGDVVVRSPVAPAGPSAPTVVPVTPTAPTVQTVAATRTPQVLGSQVTRSPSALAATGDGTTNLVPFGLGLVLLGFAIQRKSKTLSAVRVR